MTTTVEAATTTSTATAAARRPVVAALAGVGMTLLSFLVAAPEFPETLTAESARAYLTDNSGALLFFGMSTAACGVLLLVLLGHLRQRMTGALRDVAFGSGLLIAVWFTVSGAFHASTALDGIDGKPDELLLSAVGLQIAGDSIGSAATYARGALLLAVGIAAVRARTLPAWLGWLSAVLGAMALGGGLGVVENPVTPILWYAGLIGFAIWPMIVGITLLVRRPSA